MCSCDTCDFSENSYIIEHLWMAASALPTQVLTKKPTKVKHCSSRLRLEIKVGNKVLKAEEPKAF